jgi:hypothetical protein
LHIGQLHAYRCAYKFNSAQLLSAVRIYEIGSKFFHALPAQRTSRDRTSLVAERSRLKNRIQKILEDAKIKLGSVASDILGKSGRAMLTTMVKGKQNPQELADLAQGQLRLKIPQLAANGNDVRTSKKGSFSRVTSCRLRKGPSSCVQCLPTREHRIPRTLPLRPLIKFSCGQSTPRVCERRL